MKRHLIVLLVFGISAIGIAQDNQYQTAADSDPEASAILASMEEAIDAFSIIQSDFSIILNYPGAEQTTLDGQFFQEGNKYRIITEAYAIYCDGIDRWVYDIENGEVSLYAADTTSIITPTDYLRLYRQEEYVYRMTDPRLEGTTAIEFKPLDDFSDYSKLRLSVDENTAIPQSLEVFEKGGGRMTIVIETISEGASRPAEWYRFNTAANPDVHIEDLRID